MPGVAPWFTPFPDRRERGFLTSAVRSERPYPEQCTGAPSVGGGRHISRVGAQVAQCLDGGVAARRAENRAAWPGP